MELMVIAEEFGVDTDAVLSYGLKLLLVLALLKVLVSVCSRTYYGYRLRSAKKDLESMSMKEMQEL